MEERGFGKLLATLLEQAHETAPGELAALIRRGARAMGLSDASVFLADVQQLRLVQLPDGPAPPTPPERAAALPIDGTLAGWAYRTMSMRLSSSPELVLWLPLVDGIERIGVLRIAAPAVDAATVAQCQALASLVALTVVSKTDFSDVILQTVRSRPMSLQAELAWAFMPPSTLGTRQVSSSAVLEPAYEIGGDAFDHSLTDGRLHLTVVDAMGHDLLSGLSSAVALAGCRSTRRGGGGLVDITTAVDEALTRWVPDRPLTGVFADLDITGGELTWVNHGHPPPLLIRHQRVVPGALTRRSQLPLGLGPGYDSTPSTVHHAQLEPGDRILIHTDGVTEAHSASGEYFGEPRLIDTIVRATAAGEPAPEALRRLVHAILDHQHGRLNDDATILLAEWHPHPPEPPSTGAAPG
ncbi:PP2C family protein-serine/threonine phosphatase [Kitasatospora sp. NPDC052896]|uniref:PP2C family protein-serine/threonine phosphatase n=1 Tax=Kitasatospora sp. NPDC052896 TaxID=3364061 RepID=UPI0037CAF743